jgi:hypothetical protein
LDDDTRGLLLLLGVQLLDAIGVVEIYSRSLKRLLDDRNGSFDLRSRRFN